MAVIFELTGPNAGYTGRLAGFEFVDGELHVPDQSVSTIEPVITRFYGARRKGQPLNDQTLRGDGPTIEQFEKAGYKAEHYPPEGYAPKESKGWTKEKARRAAAAEAAAKATAPTDVEALRIAMPHAEVLLKQVTSFDAILELTKTQLIALDGIGEAKATEVIAWREKYQAAVAASQK